MVAPADELHRIFSALITPTREDESVDYGVIEKLVEGQIARGVEGFYCCGSSGEGPLLTLQERRQVVRTVVQSAAGRVPVIAHVGSPRTADATALALAASKDGATAVSAVPPYYYGYNPGEIEQYYRAILAASDLPVILYNIPQFTGVSFDHNNSAALFSEPRVIGLKHTEHNLYVLERLRSAHPEKVFLNGFDEIYLSALAAGATATVGTTVNIQPELFLAVRRNFDAGDMKEAQRVQSQINHVVETLVTHGVFTATKYVVSLQGYATSGCRAPFRPLDIGDRAALEALHEQMKAFEATLD
ncbi:dihydrodipicolinate synthase family protein [Nesterenkonia haasae]|uniref:dihydrodipicolinate synthase family protein n=1 Tax=Nesterenkonia haasae TaxID=2587813 RepID=UPI001390EA47|nr:dihydrodipicolinate synthase family protein [Nesterenkonia haasae]NDK31111.1 dihydrodipicolinate synthase family protein [Nesterenkonia haasae]